MIFYGDILKLLSLFTFLSYHVLQCAVCKNVTLRERSRSELMLFIIIIINTVAVLLDICDWRMMLMLLVT